eukprot:scaffold7260_cov97-Skeletonema_dohrnii-CCMP3373.AAC.6
MTEKEQKIQRWQDAAADAVATITSAGHNHENVRKRRKEERKDPKALWSPCGGVVVGYGSGVAKQGKAGNKWVSKRV